jgi:Mrp family chromosome partitioning ATPase
MIDTALLVVRANRTPYPLSAKAVEAIGPDRILGVVLNRAQDTDLADGGYYYSKYRYSYGHHKERNSKGWRKWLARRRSGR